MSEVYQHTEYELRNDIDNINCIPYTFERYVEEVNHFIDRLLEDTKEINVLRSDIKEKDKEIERLNNIINELERRFNQELENNEKWDIEDTKQFYSKKWYKDTLNDFKNMIKN